MKLCIDLFCGPGISHRILRHFKARGCNAACIYRLRGCDDNAGILQHCHCLIGGGHIGDLDVILHAVCDNLCGFLDADLVLCCAGHKNVSLNAPGLLTLEEGHAKPVGVVLNPVAAGCTHLEKEVNLFIGGDAVRIVDISVGAGDGNNLAAELVDLLYGTPSNVTEAGDCKGLSLDVIAEILEHFNGVINRTVACRLGTDERATVGDALTGEDAGELVTDALILSVEVADLTRTDTDVARGNIGICTDVLTKLGHKGLAECHNLSVRLALRVEVGATLTAAHGKRGEGVFEGLLEAEELDNAFVYGGVETKSALVGTDSAVKLNTEAAVDLHIAVVINPRNTELDNSFGLDDTLHNAGGYVVGSLHEDGLDRGEDLLNGLVELGLAGVTLYNSFVKLVKILKLEHSILLLNSLRIKYTTLRAENQGM